MVANIPQILNCCNGHPWQCNSFEKRRLVWPETEPKPRFQLCETCTKKKRAHCTEMVCAGLVYIRYSKNPGPSVVVSAC
jgi:hypothetical protein